MNMYSKCVRCCRCCGPNTNYCLFCVGQQIITKRHKRGNVDDAELMTLWAHQLRDEIVNLVCVCVCVSNWSLRTIARRTRHDTMEKFVQNRKKWPRASYCLVTIITIKLSWHISLSISSICLSISFTHRHTNRVLNWFVCTWLNIASNNCVVSIYSSVGIIRQWLAVWLLFAVTSLY